MPDNLDAIRARIDILDLVQERVKLSRVGKYWKGLCPFHTEKTPSFHVYPEKQRFHCFGCQATGDIFEWTKRIENLEFKGALELLAARAGVELAQSQSVPKDVKDRALAAVEVSAKFFEECLRENQPVLDYLRERGMEQGEIQDWRIGYAPEDSESFVAYLKKNSIKLADAATSQLLVGDEKSGYRPFFTGRLMFPICDERGAAIAFSGRAFGTTPGGKYVNSKESILFAKSQTFYALHKAKKALLETKQATLVEGQFDAIACHKAGIKNAIAPLGTAFSERHAQVLKRWCDKVVLFFDSDVAGIKAAERTAIILENEKLQCRIVRTPTGMDPDTLLQSQGIPSLHEAVKQAVTPLRFAVDRLRTDLNLVPGKENPEFWMRVRALLQSARDRTEADRIITELASLHPRGQLDSTVAVLRADIAAKKPIGRTSKKIEQPRQVEIISGFPSAFECEVLRAALLHDWRSLVWARLADEDLFPTSNASGLAKELGGLSADPPDWDPGETLEKLSEESRKVAIEVLQWSLLDPTEQTILDALKRLDDGREKRAGKKRLEVENSDEALAEYFRQLGKS